MAQPPAHSNEKLASIFAKVNMSDLPAMSTHVRELIALSHSSQTTGYELTKAILKDYALTNKILRVVNSAYYARGRQISSISKAVTFLGFNAVRDLATSIVLFEDFIKTGVEKEGISKLLTQSFLSATQASALCSEKNLNVPPEEAFICTLFHNLGRIIVMIYLPVLWREIDGLIAGGKTEEAAARAVLDDLTFSQIGEEIAKFWNLSETIVRAMIPDPSPPATARDTERYLQNLAVFTNKLTKAVCSGEDLAKLLSPYESFLMVTKEDAIKLVNNSVEACEDISDTFRYGISKLKLRSRIRGLEKGEEGEAAAKEPHRAIIAEKDIGRAEAPPEIQAKYDEKTVNDFMREITETLAGPFNLQEFYINLLEALYRGVGFDRVILGVINIQAKPPALVGRFGLGDISPEGIQGFNHPLDNPRHAITHALKNCKDLAIPSTARDAFPESVRLITQGRAVYLFPISLDNKSIGLIYVDRKAERPSLNETGFKAARIFRDFAITALRKVRARTK